MLNYISPSLENSLMEEYAGVKFRIEKLERERWQEISKKYSKEIDWLIGLGKELKEKGFLKKKEGNISRRVEVGFLISATGTDLGALKKNDIVLVKEFDFENHALKRAAGLKEPSSETPLHWKVYNETDAEAIVHVHAFPKSKKIIPIVPVLPYGSKKLAQEVSNALKKSSCCIAEGHGTFIRGEDFKKILDILQKK